MRTTLKGSSPLTRGKLLDELNDCWELGLIPAHAGKTFTRSELGGVPEAHPRSRGENIQQPGAVVRTSGSSPLTRGKHGVLLGDLEEAGLIPTHAGKTRYLPDFQ